MALHVNILWYFSKRLVKFAMTSQQNQMLVQY